MTTPAPRRAVTSHDLLTPLTIVRGWARTLLDADVDEETRRTGLQAILDSAIRLEEVARAVIDGAEVTDGADVTDVTPS